MNGDITKIIKELKARFKKVIKLGYCQAQCLFPERMAQFYNAGLYGWNYDAIAINNVLITTGYRNHFGIIPDYELVKKYELKAQNLSCLDKDYKLNLYNLQQEFIKKVFKED